MYLTPISCFSSKWICKYIITHGYAREDFSQESKKPSQKHYGLGMLFYVRSWRFLCFTYLRIELNSQFRINTLSQRKKFKSMKKTKLEKEITHKLCHWDVSINCIWIYLFFWIYLEWTTLHTQWWKQVKGYTWLNYFLIKWVAWQTKESALLTLPLPNLLSSALVDVIF